MQPVQWPIQVTTIGCTQEFVIRVQQTGRKHTHSLTDGGRDEPGLLLAEPPTGATEPTAGNTPSDRVGPAAPSTSPVLSASALPAESAIGPWESALDS